MKATALWEECERREEQHHHHHMCPLNVAAMRDDSLNLSCSDKAEEVACLSTQTNSVPSKVDPITHSNTQLLLPDAENKREEHADICEVK